MVSNERQPSDPAVRIGFPELLGNVLSDGFDVKTWITESGEFVPDVSAIPCGVLSCHFSDEFLNFDRDLGAAGIGFASPAGFEKVVVPFLDGGGLKHLDPGLPLRRDAGEQDPESAKGKIGPGLRSLPALDVVEAKRELALHGDEPGGQAHAGLEHEKQKPEGISGKTKGKRYEGHRGRIAISGLNPRICNPLMVNRYEYFPPTMAVELKNRWRSTPGRIPTECSLSTL